MTATTTEREILSKTNGRVPDLDSPAARARARASIPVTDSEIKKADWVASLLDSWWVWTAQPTSFQAVWRMSAVDRTRIPNNSTVLRLLWRVSNWTDRLVMFALILTLPTAFTGGLRLIAQRPMRRVGLYLTLAALAGLYLYGRNN
jgi:hypothetical protein